MVANTDTTFEELVHGTVILGAIGAGLGLVYYGYHHLTNQLALDAAWWHYAGKGAGVVAAWSVAEWLFMRLFDVYDWRAADNPTWKRVVSYSLIGLLLGFMLLLALMLQRLRGE